MSSRHRVRKTTKRPGYLLECVAERVARRIRGDKNLFGLFLDNVTDKVVEERPMDEDQVSSPAESSNASEDLEEIPPSA
ncbi:hypothetical protein N7522_006428 [Penicillium canescens]|nr:hypothetical protein N7522_006428 [Penicillium canescens]